MNATDTAIRWITAATVLGLGLVAAIVSYQHGLDVAIDHGQHGWTARLTPLTIDGVVLAGGMILLACARTSEKAPRLAYATLGIGIGATLYVNGLYGASYGKVGIAVAAWPAVAFVFATELLMGLIRRSQTRADSPTRPAAAPTLEVPDEPTTDPSVQHLAADGPLAEDVTDDTEPVDPVQALREGVLSLMVSAKRSGISYEKIATLVPANTYQVTKAIKPLLSPDPSPDTSSVGDTDETDVDAVVRAHFADGANVLEISRLTGLPRDAIHEIASNDPNLDWARYAPFPTTPDTASVEQVNGHPIGADQ